MLCVKCKKEIPDGSAFCNWCGRKQTPTQKKTRRRAKGMGTIRKDTRYASPWIAIAPPTTKGTNGKYIGAFKTQREAQEALEKYQGEKFPDLYNADLAKIYELWSATHFETVSKSAVYNYSSLFDKLSELHGIKMRLLKTADFQRMVDNLGEHGYSWETHKKLKGLCSQLCKYAMQNDIMDKNYAEFVKLPKKEKKERQIFTADDLRVLWQHTDDKRVQVVLVLVYMGFRIGELAAVKPSDVDYENHYIVGGEKTEAGRNRIVPFPSSIPEIEQFVKTWAADCQTETLIGKTAEHIRSKMFYPVLAELGLIEPPIYDKKLKREVYKNPRLTPHCARHTFATISVNAGIAPENLQKIIGHANYQTTADIYVHKDFETLAADMGKLKKY